MLKDEAAELVHAFRQGDAKAFNRLVELYQSKVYNLAYSYVKDQEEAKDLTQDIFVTVYRSLSALKDPAKFSSWLYQTALNHCRNRYRRLQRRGFFETQSLNDEEHPLQLASNELLEKTIEEQETTDILLAELAKMSETEKEILILRDLQGLSYEEISKTLQIPLGTVKSKLNRARLALKHRLRSLL
jgi:RNA polymerase sigma-70 factor (ECF subfamily)